MERIDCAGKSPDMVILSQRLAGYLMLNGFVLRQMRKDTDSSRNVFIFRESDNLHKAIKAYSLANEEGTNDGRKKTYQRHSHI